MGRERERSVLDSRALRIIVASLGTYVSTFKDVHALELATDMPWQQGVEQLHESTRQPVEHMCLGMIPKSADAFWTQCVRGGPFGVSLDDQKVSSAFRKASEVGSLTSVCMVHTHTVKGIQREVQRATGKSLSDVLAKSTDAKLTHPPSNPDIARHAILHDMSEAMKNSGIQQVEVVIDPTWAWKYRLAEESDYMSDRSSSQRKEVYTKRRTLIDQHISKRVQALTNADFEKVVQALPDHQQREINASMTGYLGRDVSKRDVNRLREFISTLLKERNSLSHAVQSQLFKGDLIAMKLFEEIKDLESKNQEAVMKLEEVRRSYIVEAFNGRDNLDTYQALKEAYLRMDIRLERVSIEEAKSDPKKLCTFE